MVVDKVNPMLASWMGLRLTRVWGMWLLRMRSVKYAIWSVKDGELSRGHPPTNTLMMIWKKQHLPEGCDQSGVEPGEQAPPWGTPLQLQWAVPSLQANTLERSVPDLRGGVYYDGIILGEYGQLKGT